MKKPFLFLRIAAVLTFIHAVLHTVGGVFGKAEPGPATVAVEAMKSNHFVLMGAQRTFWDFYFGFGLAISIFLTFEAIVFWQLGSLARQAGPRLRPILITFAVAYAVFAVDSYRYFFLPPVVTEGLISACLIGAVVTCGGAELG